jgi:hypothetical protein
MGPLRRNRFLLASVAAFFSVLVALAAAPADNPVVDSRRAETATVIRQATVEAVPSARNFYDVLKLAPQMNLRTEVNSRGTPTQTWFGNEQWSIQGRVSNYRKLEGSYELRKEGVTFPSGHTGNVRMSVHSLPNPRINLGVFNLRYEGRRLPNESWSYLPTGVAFEPTQTDRTYPLTPNPYQPTPTYPYEPPQTSGFVPYLGGPVLRDGTMINFEMQALPHNTHESHAVTWEGRQEYLCLKAIGTTQGTMRNATPNAFELVRTAPPRPGFQWSTFSCKRDGAGAILCNGEGTFYGQRVLARGTSVVQPGSMGGEGRMDVEVVQTKSVVPFGMKYSF